MISSAYTYYLSQYAGRENSNTNNRYTTHKKSELRNIYNSMVKANRRSPLYKIEEPDEAQKYAIDLKEASFALIDVASALEDGDSKSGFVSKKASSSNENVAVARYIGDDDGSNSMKEYRLNVKNIATSQINTGNYFDPDRSDLDVGAYSFDLNIGEYSYEFQFNVNSQDDNRSVEEKLVRLINRSNVGLKAAVKANETGQIALSLESVNTGLSEGRDRIFEVTDNKEGNNAVAILGIDNVVVEAANAQFTVNGLENSSPSNTFIINKEFEVTVKEASVGEKDTVIGFKADLDAIIDNLSTLVEGYNKIVGLAREKTDGTYENSKLLRDITGMSKDYRDYLESSGLKVDEEGFMRIDEALVAQAAEEGTLTESLERFTSFKDMLLRKASDISINPMNYVNKKLIAYPNPIRGFTNPYVSSIYSGMMYNGYV